MTEQQKAVATKRNVAALTVAGTVAVLGLGMASFMFAWVAGTLGISAAAASQIVKAVEVGGWALTLVAATFGFGVGGAIVATIRWYLSKKARTLAIA